MRLQRYKKKNEMRKFFFIIIAVLVFGLYGCESKTTTVSSTSSIAKLSSFSFANNDSMPGLAQAVFTIEERLDTGFVYNKDSILYGTRLDSVVPKFTFAATPGAAFLTFPDTTVVLTGYDTLDFNKKPVYLTVRSSDKTATKTYQIDARVHQADPDLYIWEQLNTGVYPTDDSEQRVVTKGNNFVMMVSNGFALKAFTSADGIAWSNLGAPSGLPSGTKVRQIISDGTTLYYGQDSAIYTSTDAITWTATQTDYAVQTMLLYWNDQVWALVTNGTNYELATFADGALNLSGLQPDGEFPISDFAAVTFQSASERQRAMIIGGFAENGKSLNTRWNLEYSRHIEGNNGYRMQEFSIDRPAFTSLTGISVISYNEQLLLFGGVDEEITYFGRDILISEDEGLNWFAADTTKNQLPEVYQARQKQTAIVRDNTIYLFGGQDANTTFSDVYKGRLNSIDWDN